MRFGHATGPMSFETSGIPALTRCQVGDGTVWYLEAPIGSDYHHKSNYWQAEWFRSLLERVLPRPLGRVVSDCGSVEIVPYTDTDGAWAFLINHGGEQLNFSSGCSRVFPVMPPYPVTLEFAVPEGKTPVAATVAGNAQEFTFSDGVMRIPQICDSIWRVVRVEWK